MCSLNIHARGDCMVSLLRMQKITIILSYCWAIRGGRRADLHKTHKNRALKVGKRYAVA